MLYNKISNDMTLAMKNHDKDALATLRMLKSAIDLDKINNKLEDITDDLVIKIISKQVKTLNESILDFEKAKREDLITKANKEIKLLKTYLPEELSEEEVCKILDESFNKINPSGIKDMGVIIKDVSSKVKGRYDMSALSNLIKERLK